VKLSKLDLVFRSGVMVLCTRVSFSQGSHMARVDLSIQKINKVKAQKALQPIQVNKVTTYTKVNGSMARLMVTENTSMRMEPPIKGTGLQISSMD
jgi:hypothetical protein